MSSFMAATPAGATASGSAVEVEGAHLGILLTLVVAVAWLLELRRRQPQLQVQLGSPVAVQDSLWRARQLWPEGCGALTLLLLAVVLLAGGTNRGAPMQEGDEEIWRMIRNEWPVLTTADSLLSLQGMLQLLLLLSAACRWREARASPLAGWPLAFFLLASQAKGALLLLSPPDVYHLDGPLGGGLHLVVQTACILLISYLALAEVYFRGLPCLKAALLALTVSGAVGWVAMNNRMALADPGHEYLDVLFSLGQLLELAASLSFAVRSISGGGEPLGAFSCFANMLLPVQQFLSAYFLLTAWGGAPLQEIDALVGAGSPLIVLQLAAVCQIGCYIVGAVSQVIFSREADKLQGFYIEI